MAKSTKEETGMNSLHVMIDIETIGQTCNAAVVQIGAVLFDIGTGEAFKQYDNWDSTFLANIDFESALQHGETNGKTITWWMKQSEEARSSLFTPEPQGLKATLKDLFHWWQNAETYAEMSGLNLSTGLDVWSHATFDSVILNSAYRSIGRRTPWSLRRVRDLRTLFALFPSQPIERSGTHHNALDDALHQARLASYSIAMAMGLFDRYGNLR